MLPEKYAVHLEYSSIKPFLPTVWPTIENLKVASKETLEYWLNISVNPKVIELCSKDLQWKHSRPWDKYLPEIFIKNELYVDSPVPVGPKFFQNKLHSSTYFSTKNVCFEGYVIVFHFKKSFYKSMLKLKPKYDCWLAPGSICKCTVISDIWIHVPIPECRNWAVLEREFIKNIKYLPLTIKGILPYIEKVSINQENMIEEGIERKTICENYRNKLEKLIFDANRIYNLKIYLE